MQLAVLLTRKQNNVLYPIQVALVQLGQQERARIPR